LNHSLIKICKEFETIKDYLKDPSKAKEMVIHRLFFEFVEVFSSLKEEKLDYPSEFRNDARLYQEGFEPLMKKFDDVEIRYLMLSDFYDFVRITKRYRP
jgi:hypothetical protein